MAPSPNNILILTVILTFSGIQSIVVKQENSLYGPYEEGAPNIAYWDLSGSAHLEQTYIRLTPDEPGKVGGIWNTHPVLPNDWELHMQFHIHGKGTHLNGNGIAIWYAKEVNQPGPVFGSKDYFSGLGIFIDTHEDPLNPHMHMHPYISAVVNNGSQSYEHNEDGTVHQVGGCFMPVRNVNWPTKIAVSYIHHVLTIFLDAEGNEQWTQCLRSEGVYLPSHYFFGITANTGQAYSDNHDIIYITALDMNLPDQQYEDRSYIVPFAENVLVHPKFSSLLTEADEILKTIEQLQHMEEQFKHEEKREVHQIHPPTDQKPQEKEMPTQQKPRLEGIIPHQASWFKKAVYIMGTLLILYVAFMLFKKYKAQREERMLKRLY